MVQRVVTVNDVLDGHVALDVECEEMIFLTSIQPGIEVNREDRP